MNKYGCIGKKLTHSFSKEIHEQLADYPYELMELTEDELPSFFAKKEFAGINVTMPYKQTVIPYLDHISDVAHRIGAVNTVVNRDGRLYGDNTDYYGMQALIRRVGIDLKGKKVLILGTGGTSRTARAVVADLGATEVLTVSRTASPGHITYPQAALYADTAVIINTTPCGMYPDTEATPIDVTLFPRLEGVIDAVYNPLRTNLVLDAQTAGIKAEGGLYMLVMQAVAAVERFLGVTIAQDKADGVFSTLLAAKENIVLTGMPDSGKSTVGRVLAADGYPLFDTDAAVETRCGCTIKELIATKGEADFRDLETEVIRDLSAVTGAVIATGGGAILREENVRRLKRNGKLYFLDAPLTRLCADDTRPLADTAEKLTRLYEERIHRYRATADAVVPSLTTPKEEAEYILAKRME